MEKKKELLLSVGLNELEADVYLALLSEDLITGYRIGKILGKPTANVYKAIESLSKKGALILEDQKKGLCKAIPTDVFFGTIENSIKRTANEAKKLFNKPLTSSYDERSYQIQSSELVLQKCREMLRACTTIAVIDAFPKTLSILAPDIVIAQKNGVKIVVQAYQQVDIPGVNLTIPKSSPEILRRWDSQQLNIVVDCKEYILALFSEDLTQVYYATWSKNLYLASMYHIGFINENTIHKIQDATAQPNLKERIEEILANKSFLSNDSIPGVEELLQRFGLSK